MTRDPELLELRKRTAERMEQAKQAMGSSYILHPSNPPAKWGTKQK